MLMSSWWPRRSCCLTPQVPNLDLETGLSGYYKVDDKNVKKREGLIGYLGMHQAPLHDTYDTHLSGHAVTGIPGSLCLETNPS